jgi:SAM-dependent methyltransferase
MEQRPDAAPGMNTAADDALAAFARGEISAEIALMRLLLVFGDAPRVLAHLEAAAEVELLKVVRAHGDGFARTGALVEAGLAAEHRSVAAIRAQFDAAVRLAPEASVALYSLGSAETLDRTTAEIVALLDGCRLLGPAVAVLDIGCGIGRIARALAPHVASITGIDVSPAMIAEAKQRCRDLVNVDFAVCGGTDLVEFAGRRFGLILAVDAFPYLVVAGGEIAARHVADAAALLGPGGALVILNYSYRGDLDHDRADVAELATRRGFVVERSGTRDFALWDGATFLLRKTSANCREIASLRSQ